MIKLDTLLDLKHGLIPVLIGFMIFFILIDAQAEATTGAAPAASGAPDEDQDMDMSTNDGVAEFNAYVNVINLGNSWHHTNFY